jgi:ABC-type bacteriocin/lantibiotic exporter with double-glycine peptidase domain
MQSMGSKAHAPFVKIQNGYFGWENGNDWVLRDINLDFPSSQLTIVIGPIGCGKTTLCKALLGEVPFTQGQVICRGRLTGIGFCDQIPYLASQSVRDIILGDLDFDPIWYDEVIEATALGADLKVFPKGANTTVGTKGTNLSGGQRQRIAIATKESLVQQGYLGVKRLRFYSVHMLFSTYGSQIMSSSLVLMGQSFMSANSVIMIYLIST